MWLANIVIGCVCYARASGSALSQSDSAHERLLGGGKNSLIVQAPLVLHGGGEAAWVPVSMGRAQAD